MKRPLKILAVSTVLLAIQAFGDDVSIEDLGWLTGEYSGKFGPMELEETWNEPKAGSIQALVRITDGVKTDMVEIVVIDEVDGSFELKIQQWDAGLKARTDGPQTMKQVNVGEREITFEAVDDGPLTKLTYKKSNDDELQIIVENELGRHEMTLAKK